MSSYRVLLHAMTFYRDYATLHVLAALLEQQGCSCLIVDNESYLGPVAKAWKPDAVFFVTSGRFQRLIDAYPDARFFYCAGEGGEDEQMFDEQRILEKPEFYQRMERIYLWGNRCRSYIERYVARPEHATVAKLVAAKDKMLVSGAPRFDLMKFRERRPRPAGVTRVGFVGSFSVVNNTKGLHPVSWLMNHPHLGSHFHVCVALISLYTETFKHLTGEEFKLSLRPYPLERRKTYAETDIVRKGNLHIDYSLDFSSWLTEQDVVVGDISSTTAACILYGNRFYCTAKAAPRDTALYYFSLADYYKEQLDSISPNDATELASMIRSDSQPTYPADLMDLFEDMYGYRNQKSALATIARDIVKTLSERPPLRPDGIPTKLARAVLWRPFPSRQSYSSIDRRVVRSALAKDLGRLTLRICQEAAAGRA